MNQPATLQNTAQNLMIHRLIIIHAIIHENLKTRPFTIVTSLSWQCKRLHLICLQKAIFCIVVTSVLIKMTLVIYIVRDINSNLLLAYYVYGCFLSVFLPKQRLIYNVNSYWPAVTNLPWHAVLTSLCSASYVHWQCGTIHISPLPLLSIMQQSTDVSCWLGPQQQTCSSWFAAVGPR